MSDVVIRAEGLGKKYLIGHETDRERYTALRDVMARTAKNIGRSAMDMARGRQLFTGEEVEEFWALKDVSFEIKRGEVVGIIGRNGAGKSTVLKILSRITEPSAGRVEIKGRVASLLEVGTGFHPELTGRENIYLNGAILGMTRAEIRRKFDEIVAFAEIEKFLDTPVKRYSSGMYVRLAFAVAAHLEPEILIIDEVLAVGDAEFQKKCLGKMGNVVDEGRTVLFVSHNMNAIQNLCKSCMLLEEGRLRLHSEDVRNVTTSHLTANQRTASEWFATPLLAQALPVQPLHIFITDKSGEKLLGPARCKEDLFYNCVVRIKERDPSLTLGFAIYAEDGNLLYWSYTTDGKEETWPSLGPGLVAVRARLPKQMLNEGRYNVEFISSLHFRCWFHRPGEGPLVSFELQGGLSESPLWQNRRPGLLAPLIEWSSAPVSDANPDIALAG